MRRFVIVALFLIFPLQGFAAETTSLVDIEKARKRLYIGGRDEEDLKVLAALPEAIRKTDERVIQNEVHKVLFNEELKTEAAEDAVDSEIGH